MKKVGIISTVIVALLSFGCHDPWRKIAPQSAPQVVFDAYAQTHDVGFSVPSGRSVTVVVSTSYAIDNIGFYDHRIELAQNGPNNQGATAGAQVGDVVVISNRGWRQILAGDAGRWTYTIPEDTSVQMYYDGVGWWPTTGNADAGRLIGVAKSASND